MYHIFIHIYTYIIIHYKIDQKFFPLNIFPPLFVTIKSHFGWLLCPKKNSAILSTNIIQISQIPNFCQKWGVRMFSFSSQHLSTNKIYFRTTLDFYFTNTITRYWCPRFRNLGLWDHGVQDFNPLFYRGNSRAHSRFGSQYYASALIFGHEKRTQHTISLVVQRNNYRSRSNFSFS